MEDFRFMVKIKEIKDGVYVKSIYLCSKKQVKVTKRGDDYFSLILKDDTGCMPAKMFGVRPSDFKFTENSFIYVEGRAESYEGEISLNLNTLRLAKEGEYNPSDFLPKSPYKMETMWQSILKLVEEVKEPHLKKILESFYQNKTFQKAFCSRSDSLNRPYIGGLLESTLWVANLAKFLSNKYNPVNKDLLLTGALLCKVGRIKQMTAFPEDAYTDEGRLYGSIYLTVQMVEKQISAIEGFPIELQNKLLHMLLSSRGEKEYGSPVVPMTLEAHLLASVIALDSKAVQITQMVEKGKENEVSFTPYNPLLGANYYVK